MSLNKESIIEYVETIVESIKTAISCYGIEDIERFCNDCLFFDVKEREKITDDTLIRIEQIDAIIDILYYTFNVMSKNKIEYRPCTENDDLVEFYNSVRQFTEESSSPMKPVKKETTDLSIDEVKFFVSMIFSELVELLQTVTNNLDEAKDILKESVNYKNDNKFLIFMNTNEEKLNLFCNLVYTTWLKINNLDSNIFREMFNEVHDANMRKKNPETGNFIIRESDGKILKPEGWIVADLTKFYDILK
jgi:predicted HAD superfamily Cof-like phosphohydrolase